MPEDRQADGLVGNMTIAENLMLNRSFHPPFVERGTLQLDRLDEFAKEKLKQYDVRAPGITTHADKLSGGNQQKVVVARELSRDLRLLVAAQPTRGVDVGSIEFIHTQIVAARDAASPCWWSRPSSTRSSPSPTASWSSTAAGSSASCHPTRHGRCSA